MIDISYPSQIRTLLDILGEQSSETLEHSERMVPYCMSLGSLLNFDEQEIQDMMCAALLHDIGKLQIPTYILHKPGQLSAQEWQEMKRHPEIGYQMLTADPALHRYAEDILYHHERWDGSGYPTGRQEEEIPLHSRILSIVDAYDTMIHHRSYKRAMSRSEAISELKRNSGSQFDPKLVMLFIQMIEE